MRSWFWLGSVPLAAACSAARASSPPASEPSAAQGPPASSIESVHDFGKPRAEPRGTATLDGKWWEEAAPCPEGSDWDRDGALVKVVRYEDGAPVETTRYRGGKAVTTE